MCSGGCMRSSLLLVEHSSIGITIPFPRCWYSCSWTSILSRPAVRLFGGGGALGRTTLGKVRQTVEGSNSIAWASGTSPDWNHVPPNQSLWNHKKSLVPLPPLSEMIPSDMRFLPLQVRQRCSVCLSYAILSEFNLSCILLFYFYSINKSDMKFRSHLFSLVFYIVI